MINPSWECWLIGMLEQLALCYLRQDVSGTMKWANVLGYFLNLGLGTAC